MCSHEISKKNPHYFSSLTHFGVGGVSGSDGGVVGSVAVARVVEMAVEVVTVAAAADSI